MPTRSTSSLHSPRRRGSAYVIVLGVSMLVTVMALSGLLAGRVRQRADTAANDMLEARRYADSGIELAMLLIKLYPAWRDTLTHDQFIPPQPIGRGAYQFKFIDEVDANLNNGDGPVRIEAWGMAGNAVQKASVRIEPPAGPLTCLQTGACAVGNITINGSVTVSNGPFATAGTYTNIATTNGDVEAAILLNTGVITGSATVPATARTMPQPSVYDQYLATATAIPFASLASGTITKKLISSASNPFGSTAANAVYSITVPAGSTLTITQSRIVATLIVDLGAGARLITSNQFLWQAPDSQPALIVHGSAGSSVELNGSTQSLKESTNNVNFNPVGTPFNNVTDNDKTDTYPTELRGLVHVTTADTAVTLANNFKINGGALLTEGAVTMNGATVIVDTALFTNPPTGYTPTGDTTLRITAGTWRREVD